MKVYVGVSGGVDSAVSAALLQEQGHEVTAVFIKIWQPEFTECTWKEDRLDAMRVAAALGIPFREVDLSNEYKKTVVDVMVADYARGITPNPDVLCNRYIKFGSFAEWCLNDGAERIATGHYAQVRSDGDGHHLLRAADASKDQSYFLHRLDQRDLAHALFPIGGMQKSEVRAEALRRKLPVAKKPDSQGLCFAGHISMHEFLARYISLVPGPVVMDGKTIGEHHGAALYTIGQRHGFTVHADHAAPHYVKSIDVATNVVSVSLRREDVAREFVNLEDVHWIGNPVESDSEITIQARYHEHPIAARITTDAGSARVQFSQPNIASPGQSLVMYRGNECLGGGVILL